MDAISTILTWMNTAGPSRRFKLVEDGYLIAIGTGDGGEEIDAGAYDELRALFTARPEAPEGYEYRLTAGLEWEQCELPPAPEEVPPEQDELLDPARALELICGTSTVTKLQAEAVREEINSAKLAREERKEQREE